MPSAQHEADGKLWFKNEQNIQFRQLFINKGRIFYMYIVHNYE